MDYHDPSAGYARLAVAKANATREQRGTLFFNPGGPGVSGLEIMNENGTQLVSFAGGVFDVVSWDPRGVGSLTFPGEIHYFDSVAEYNDFFNGTIELTGIEMTGNFTDPVDINNLLSQAPIMQRKYEETANRCINHPSGKFLKYVGTAATVRDMVSMADAFDGTGVPVNYLGTSYRTTSGSWFLNMFPERVGRVILDGVVDPTTVDFSTSIKTKASGLVVSSAKMPWCELCNCWFTTEQALWLHEDYSSVHNFICRACNKNFKTRESLIQHYVQSLRHFYCQRCDKHFDGPTDLRDHNINDHYLCLACDVILDSEVGLHEHCRQKHSDRYCIPCKLMFQSENNLRQHQRSAVHEGRTEMCPMEEDCGRSFPTPAAVILHFESGTCASGMTRVILAHIVGNVNNSEIIMIPVHVIGSPKATRPLAMEHAWNGSRHECYLCPRTFKTLQALNAHLQSSAHEDRLYCCPNAWRGCRKEFRILSAFF